MHSLGDCFNRLFLVQLYNFSFLCSLLTISAVISRGKVPLPLLPAWPHSSQRAPVRTSGHILPLSTTLYGS